MTPYRMTCRVCGWYVVAPSRAFLYRRAGTHPDHPEGRRLAVESVTWETFRAYRDKAGPALHWVAP